MPIRIPLRGSPRTTSEDIPPRDEGRLLVGASMRIDGELSVDSDLVVDGEVEGMVTAPGHRVTVGSEGRIAADVAAESVVVEGEVCGKIVATGLVRITSSGRVRGPIFAPRVVLEDGCSFSGRINEDAEFAEKRFGAAIDQALGVAFEGPGERAPRMGAQWIDGTHSSPTNLEEH